MTPCLRTSWIIRLIAERFGIDFNIFEQENKFYRVGIAGSERNIFVKKSEHFYECGRPTFGAQLVTRQLANFLQHDIPVFAPGLECADQLITEHIDGLQLNYDVFGLTYWMLTRAEEIGRNSELDSHGRFPSSASHGATHGYLQYPVVDVWLAIFAQLVKITWPEVKLKRHEFKIALSHDVDQPSQFAFCSPINMLKNAIGDAIKRKNLRYALQSRPWGWLSPLLTKQIAAYDPFNTFDWLIELANKHSLESTFFFLAGHSHTQYDANYKLSNESIQKLLRKIRTAGHKIGIHPSYNCIDDLSQLEAEVFTIRQSISNLGLNPYSLDCRMHYLRLRIPDTYEMLERSGIASDSSLGYADAPGFRAGTCFEYEYFNPINSRPLNIKVRPLVAMECSLLEYQSKSISETLEILSVLKDRCKKVNGCFSLLWHNSSLTDHSLKNALDLILSETEIPKQSDQFPISSVLFNCKVLS